jgi:protein-S-isoprenylcysteine O-methyltransferase Ste14
VSRWIVTAVLAILAAASTAGAVEAWGNAFADASVRGWSIAGFLSLRTAVLLAVSVCVFMRKPPRRHSRDPVAFVACGVALSAVVLIEKPIDTAATALVVAGDLVALAAWAWLLVSFVVLGRCFGLLPEARGLVTRGPYRLVRHPVYLGEFVAVGGLLIASSTLRNLGLVVAFAAAQSVRMRLEERALADEFPEYVSYSAATPRLVPRVRPRIRAARSTAIAGGALFALLLMAPIGTTAAKPALKAPVAQAPAAGARADGVPWFSWSPVAGAAQYEFQIAADSGMNAAVLGRGLDRFFTKNTRATLRKSLPDRTYWWRVRATTAKGAVSVWTKPRAFTKTLSAPRPQSPVGGVHVSYPATPLKLVWSPVDRAAKYLVTLAADPNLGTVIGGKPVETYATAFTRPGVLAPGTYYWGVTPVDAQGNPGTPSSVSSFVWVWPSTTTVRVGDLVAAPEVFDPQFSWDPVAGAARYELEVNASQDFAPGSKVCCTGTTIGTVYSPTPLLKDNRYYWRVRALDVDENAGVWNEGPVFDKRFDKVPPVAGTSIKNVRLRDNEADPGNDVDAGTPGYETNVPMIAWDPVPGASSYQVEVTPMGTSDCNWTASGSHWVVNTTVNAWTPLGSGWNLRKPYPDPMAVATDLTGLVRYTSYCARVRARSNRDATAGDVYGDYTYIVNGRGSATPGASFTWMGYPSGGLCAAPCSPGYLGQGDYLSPASGTLSPRTPFFTWDALWRPKIVLQNPSGLDALMVFQQTSKNVAVTVRNHSGDSAFDELLVYEVASTGLPIVREQYLYADGDLASLAKNVNGLTPFAGMGSDYVSAKAVGGGPLVHVDLATLEEGKRSYFVVVAKDQQFSNIVDYGFTQVPAYSPRALLKPTSYPDETTSYYWVVLPANLANGGEAVGTPLLGAPRTFEKRSTPPNRLEPAAGTDITGHPTFRWSSVEAARRYRLQVAQDDRFGTDSLLEDVLTNSTAYTSNTTYPADTVLYWRVRADDENLIGLTWSSTGSFQKRLPIPRVTPGLPTSGDYIPTWTWDPVPGAVSYDIHVDLPDGTHRDLTGARTAAMTPIVMYGTGVFRWRVRALYPRQPFGTVAGAYSPTHVFTRTIAEPTGVRSDKLKKYPLLLWEPKPGPKSYQVQISTRADFARLIENVATDNTNYAPLLNHPAYKAGQPLYWRVASVDEGRNVGDWSPTQQIGLAKKLRLLARGAPKRKQVRKIRITVLGTGNRPVAGATVRVSGAGARATRARTNRKGAITFRVRAKKRGLVAFRVTKSGYEAGTLRMRVR